MNVEVIYPLQDEQISFHVYSEIAISVRESIVMSKVLDTYPELDLENIQIGVYSEIVSLDHIVKNDDRIEIYRKLVIDPKNARMLRADKKREGKSVKDFGA